MCALNSIDGTAWTRDTVTAALRAVGVTLVCLIATAGGGLHVAHAAVLGASLANPCSAGRVGGPAAPVVQAPVKRAAAARPARALVGPVGAAVPIVRKALRPRPSAAVVAAALPSVDPRCTGLPTPVAAPAILPPTRPTLGRSALPPFQIPLQGGTAATAQAPQLQRPAPMPMPTDVPGLFVDGPFEPEIPDLPAEPIQITALGPLAIADRPETFYDVPAVQDVEKQIPAAVPEPAGLALVVTALLAACAARARRALRLPT